MADSKNPTSNENAEPISVAVEENWTDTDLDQAISEEDPEFLQSVDQISKDTELSLSVIEMPEEELSREIDAWREGGLFKSRAIRILPFLPLLSLKTRKLKTRSISFLKKTLHGLVQVTWQGLQEGKKRLLGALKSGVQAFAKVLSETKSNFRYWSWAKKAGFVATALLFLFTLVFIFRSATRGVIPHENEMFMPTLERVATEVNEYDPETDSEPFYENLRAPSNVILLPKMIVNLKKSVSSGGNPMGAFEFFVEGTVPEAVVEIKDREVEIRDLMQRVLESFTFDQIDSIPGKNLVCERLKKEVNLHLTTGKIKKVWFKTVVIKP